MTVHHPWPQLSWPQPDSTCCEAGVLLLDSWPSRDALFLPTHKPSYPSPADFMCPFSNSFLLPRIGFCCLLPRNPNHLMPFKGNSHDTGERWAQIRLRGSFPKRWFRGKNLVTKELFLGRKERIVKANPSILYFICVSIPKSFQSFELWPRWAKKTGCTFLINGPTVQTILRPNIWGWIIFSCLLLHWENNQHGLSGSWLHCSTSCTCRLGKWVSLPHVPLPAEWKSQGCESALLRAKSLWLSIIFCHNTQGSKCPIYFL